MSKLFRRFISHVTTSETEMKLFQPLKEFWNCFKIISATVNMLENIRELQQASEIISAKFPRAEIELFQTDVDERWNDFETILFHM